MTAIKPEPHKDCAAALVLIAGGEAINGSWVLAHLALMIGPGSSTPTKWRPPSEAGELQVSRRNAVTGFRRQWRAPLAARPEGFLWLKVAGRELTGVTVAGVDATIAFAASGKGKIGGHLQGGIGLCTNLATCDNTDDVLVIDPRPENVATRRKTTSLSWTRRSPGCWRRSGVGSWSAWTGPGSPTNCSSTSPQVA
jgi:hypothetical protein